MILDGDGKAEVACKTAPGTMDGHGKNVVMGADDPSIVYTNSSGYILTGPEYLTIFNGQTGAATGHDQLHASHEATFATGETAMATAWIVFSRAWPIWTGRGPVW